MFDYSHLLSSTPFPLRSSPFAVPWTAIVPVADLSWLSIVAQSSLSHLAIHPWANIIAGLRSRSTLGQTSSQDFACDPPLGKHHRRTSFANHPWANIIAGLCSRSTLGQTSLQDFVCKPPLGKHHCRTSRDPPLVNLTDPRSARIPLHSKLLPFTLSISPPPQPSSCYWIESITWKDPFIDQ